MNFKRYENDYSLKLDPQVEFDCNGHKSWWMKITHNDKISYSLFCDCDFEYQKDNNTISRKIDPLKCHVKKIFREKQLKDTILKHRDRWQQLGVLGAILDIYDHVKNGAWLGQSHYKLIFAQEVAELLEISIAKIWNYIDQLRSEEKLDLNGAILIDYKNRFRFPKEIQQLIKYIVEEPLGWPSGDAGDFFLEEIETIINQNTSFQSCKSAFHKENSPNLASRHLYEFGSTWILLALTKALNDDGAAKDLSYLSYENIKNLEKMKKLLQKLLDSERFKKIKNDVKNQTTKK